MFGVKRTDFGLFAITALVAAWIAGGVGYRFLLQPIMARSDTMRDRMAKVRIDKARLRKTRKQVAKLESRLKTMAQMFEELRSHLIRDENDRFRMDLARDQAGQGIEDLAVTPVDIRSPPLRLSFPNPMNPNVQLKGLKEAFLEQNPRAVFSRWNVPLTTDVHRYVQRFSVEGSFKDLLRLLERLEGDALLMQVSSLKVSAARAAGPSDPARITAMFELSAPGFPLLLDESSRGLD